MKMKRNFPLRVPEETYKKLKDIAERKGISVNSLINLILYDYIKNEYDVYDVEEKQI